MKRKLNNYVFCFESDVFPPVNKQQPVQLSEKVLQSNFMCLGFIAVFIFVEPPG